MEDDRYTRITLRIPKDLHAQLQAASDASSKSINAEIVGRVQQSFEAPSGRGPAIDVLQMNKAQRQAFVESIDRAMSMRNAPAETSMLVVLRDAARHEIDVIDQQIEGVTSPPRRKPGA